MKRNISNANVKVSTKESRAYITVAKELARIRESASRSHAIPGSPVLKKIDIKGKRVLDAGVKVSAIILDSRQPSREEEAIEHERTEGKLPSIPLETFQQHMVPCFHVHTHDSPQTAKLIQHLSIDLLINGGTPRILPEVVLAAPIIGVINCHPGLLPFFRGCTCVEWAIYLNEQIGNTVHFMTAGIDEGPIVVQEPLTFRKKDYYSDIRVQTYLSGFDLLARAIRRVIMDDLMPKHLPPQLPGKYFDVIDPARLEKAKLRVQNGAYAYQI